MIQVKNNKRCGYAIGDKVLILKLNRLGLICSIDKSRVVIQYDENKFFFTHNANKNLILIKNNQ